MQALTLERWVLDPGPDTADPSSSGIDADDVPYAFTWTDTGDPADLKPYAFEWEGVSDTAGPSQKDLAAGGNMGAALGSALGSALPALAGAAGASLGPVGAVAGAAVGSALGSTLPGVGKAVGEGAVRVADEIGNYFAGLFGGKRKRRRRKKKPRRPQAKPTPQLKPTPQPKPTPGWLVDVLEDARRALQEVPPNPSKAIDAVLVISGQMSREAYLKAKQTGQLPSQKYDRNRSAVVAKEQRLRKKFGGRIAAHLKGLKPAEQALVSVAMPLGNGETVLGAVQKIRATVQQAAQTQASAVPVVFAPDVVERLRQEYVIAEEQEEDGPAAPDEGPPSWGVMEPAYSIEYDTSAPATARAARAPTIEDLPKPLWHLSRPALPKHLFVRMLYLLPGLRKLPKHLLRAIAGKGPRAHDTSGVDPTMRQYVMLPGETFAGIARNLTGDPDRAVELYAANPNHNPARMRVEIPPGWLEFTPLASGDTAAPPTNVNPEPEPPKNAPAPKKAQAQRLKDGPRPNITKRVIEVLANDWPEKIANRTGAKQADARWWSTFKKANPHKIVLQDGNWQTLFAGETLNYPDTWPASIEAKPAPSVPSDPALPPPGNPGSPNPGPVTPPNVPLPPIPGSPVPTGGTSDFGMTADAQATLALWASKHPDVAQPPDFGKDIIRDVNGTMTERTKSCLSTFQLWWNEKLASSQVRTDGVLDLASYNALKAYQFDVLKDVPGPPSPGGTSPGGGGQKPTPSGNGGNQPPGGGTPPGDGFPFPGGSFPFPGGGFPFPPIFPGSGTPGTGGGGSTQQPQQQPQPQPQPPKPQPPQPQPPSPKPSNSSGKDDDAAVLIVGGTMLSLLLR